MTVGYESMQILALICLMFITLLLFLIQTTDNSRLILLVGITISTTWLSLPLASEGNALKELFENIIMDSDRIQIRIIPMFLCAALFYFRVLYILIEHKPRVAVLSLAATLSFIAVLISHEFETFSVYQVVVDFFYILGAFSVYLYMRFVISNDEIEDLYSGLIIVMIILSTMILLDLFAVILGIGNWSWSYRDGLQGFLYANEVIYSFIVGIAVIFLFSYFKNPLLKFFSIAGLILVYMSQIETGLYAVIVSLIILNKYFTRFINGKLILIALPLVASYFIFSLDLFNAEENSIYARLGTYYVAFSQLFDGDWIFGIKPGVIDFTSSQNLALMIWESGFDDIVSVLPDAISADLVRRSDYLLGAPILPHNSAIALFSSYGIIMLFPALYYYYYLPYMIVSKSGNEIPEDVLIIGRLVLFIAIFSIFHPIITPIMLVFLAECLRSLISRSKIDYE